MKLRNCLAAVDFSICSAFCLHGHFPFRLSHDFQRFISGPRHKSAREIQTTSHRFACQFRDCREMATADVFPARMQLIQHMTDQIGFQNFRLSCKCRKGNGRKIFLSPTDCFLPYFLCLLTQISICLPDNLPRLENVLLCLLIYRCF